MNQTQSNNFSVNSQFFIQQLDSLIIKITRALAVEYSITPDPDAKEMVRRILLARAHSLMSEESKNFSDSFTEKIKIAVKSGLKNPELRKSFTDTYEFLKLMGLDNA